MVYKFGVATCSKLICRVALAHPSVLMTCGSPCSGGKGWQQMAGHSCPSCLAPLREPLELAGIGLARWLPSCSMSYSASLTYVQ